jgi:hypothetical protein
MTTRCACNLSVGCRRRRLACQTTRRAPDWACLWRSQDEDFVARDPGGSDSDGGDSEDGSDSGEEGSAAATPKFQPFKEELLKALQGACLDTQMQLVSAALARCSPSSPAGKE